MASRGGDLAIDCYAGEREGAETSDRLSVGEPLRSLPLLVLAVPRVAVPKHVDDGCKETPGKAKGGRATPPGLQP